jgi:hypothetical protein
MSEPKEHLTDEPEEKSKNEQAGEQPKQARPPLGRITSITRPGVELFIPNETPIYEWAFTALPHFGGLIIPTEPIVISPSTWHALTEWGMPTDMKVIDVIFSTAGYDLKFDNFAIAATGVLVDKTDPEKGRTASEWTMFWAKKGEDGQVTKTQLLKVHFWFKTLLLKGSTAQLSARFCARETDVSSFFKRGLGVHYLLQFGEEQQQIKGAETLFAHRFLLEDSRNLLNAAAEGKRGGMTLADIRGFANEAVEHYARAQTKGGRQPETFKRSHLAKHWPRRIQSQNLYKLITRQEEWDAIEKIYDQWCRKLRSEPKTV